jgi:NAD+ synthase
MAVGEKPLIQTNYENVVAKLLDCIKTIIRKSGKKGAVVGLSGGLDSTTTLFLLTKALGRDQVHALIMPDKESSLKDVEDALLVSKKLGVGYTVIDITSIVESVLRAFGTDYTKSDKKAKGNVKARTRMILLYYYANTHDYLVAATSDRSEFLIGYFTKWGDAAGDFYPLLGLYKTQVREVARRLGVPTHIIEKPSSPGLWPGQTARGELGLDYDIIDRILYMLVDKQYSFEETAKSAGTDVSVVKRVWEMIKSSHHKREPLQTCMIGGPRE